MRIALGTINVSDYSREAIANFYGEAGKAPRDTCQKFLLDAAEAELQEQEWALQVQREDEQP